MMDMDAADRPPRSVRGQPDLARDASVEADEFERPGDAACWLRRVCPDCGTLAEVDPPAICEQCKQQIPAP
jgi:hypothetical protein